MEAACCRKKAIAISYAFYSRDHDPALIAGASRHAARLIEHIYNDWGNDVDLYSINVPLVDGVEQHKTIYTHALQNYWHSGSSFEEVEPGPDDIGPNETENDIRHQGESPGQSSRRYQSSKHKHFRWAPKFGDISQSVEEGPPGNDGWALKQGYT
ncbi:hypothetical protein MMC09_000489, partial [Bachmanniomyces sp. S44760]|nr:hypothetical protein [Bachmanniomyces sp. S44760]